MGIHEPRAHSHDDARGQQHTTPGIPHQSSRILCASLTYYLYPQRTFKGRECHWPGSAKRRAIGVSAHRALSRRRTRIHSSKNCWRTACMHKACTRPVYRCSAPATPATPAINQALQSWGWRWVGRLRPSRTLLANHGNIITTTRSLHGEACRVVSLRCRHEHDSTWFVKLFRCAAAMNMIRHSTWFDFLPDHAPLMDEFTGPLTRYLRTTYALLPHY